MSEIVKIQIIIAMLNKELPHFLIAKRVLVDGGYWNLPVGTQETSDNDDLVTINREIFEEFGIVNILGDSKIILKNAKFNWIKNDINVVEKSYLILVDKVLDINLNVHEHDEYKWLPYDMAIEMLEKDGNKKCLRVANNKIMSYLSLNQFQSV